MRARLTGVGGTGLTLALISAATFGTSGAFAASLMHIGWSPAAAVLSRITVAALLLTVPALLVLRGRWHVLRNGAGQAAAYGLIAVAGAQLFYFSAVARMPIGVALLLEYMGVVLVVGWLWVRHGQRPRRLTVVGTVTAIVGLVLVMNQALSGRINPIGVIFGLLAAVGLATYYLLSAAEGAEPMPPIVLAWAGMSIGAVTLAVLGAVHAVPIVFTSRDVHLLGSRVSWFVPVVGLAVIAAVVSYLAGIAAARLLGAKLASFVGLSEVLFAILIAWLLLNQLPTPIQFLGGGFILAGITLVRVDELRPAPRSAPTADLLDEPPVPVRVGE